MTDASLHMKWRIEFKDEDGIDSGGLTKEWFLELTKEMMSSKQGLFVAREGGTFGLDPKILTASYLHRIGGVEELNIRLKFCGTIFARLSQDVAWLAQN